MKNLEIAKIFENMADILELQEIKWKPQAYRKAAMSIESLSEDIEEVAKRGELEEIPGVGEHIAAKIEEFLKTGRIRVYEKLKKEMKIDIETLKNIPRLGPKKIKVLYKRLRVKDIKDLARAIAQEKVRTLEGFGEKTEQQLKQGMELLKKRPQRFLYATVVPVADEIKKLLSGLKSVQKIEVAGSFRRGKETVGDLDFLVVSGKPEEVMEKFTSMSGVKKVVAKGKTKSSVRLAIGLQIDLRVVKEKEFGSAMNYFIGNKEHNVELRRYALSKGYTLSEYGLFKVRGKTWVAGRTEEEIYKRLGMQYIPPELRENMGEIKVALAKQLPDLLTEKDCKGMFHNHSKWSDGNNTLLEMAQKAEELGLKFISFNDHFGPIGITHPLTGKRLSGYLKEIEKVRKKAGIRVFSGLEIDILKDGKLPLPAKQLKELDVVIASVHLATKQNVRTMTQRVCNVMENYPVHILGHPTDRILNKRPPLNLDLEKVFSVAKQRDVFLEINGSPQRMDLAGEHIKSGKDAGCKFALSTDAHDASHLPFYPFAVQLARRGWLEKKDAINCWTLHKIEKSLAR